MLHLVPALPLGEVLQAEIGRQVDDPRARVEHRARLVHGDAVRRGEEHHVAAGQRAGVGLGEGELDAPAQAREHAATGVPASLREVMAFSSTCGCCASSRSSSTPVYPVPPTMPALIILCSPKTKKPPVGGFRFAESLRSAFRVLLAPPRLVQADFLSLDLSRVARHQPGRA